MICPSLFLTSSRTGSSDVPQTRHGNWHLQPGEPISRARLSFLSLSPSGTSPPRTISASLNSTCLPPSPGITDQNLVVLRPLRDRDTTDTDLTIPADHRIQLLVFLALLYQVIAIFLQRIICSLWLSTDHSLITSDRGEP